MFLCFIYFKVPPRNVMYGQSIHHPAIWDRHPRQVMALMEHPEAVCAIYQHYVSGFEFDSS